MSYLNPARLKKISERMLKLAIVALVAPLLITGGTGAPANAVERSTADEGYINPGPNSSSTYFEAGAYIIDAGAHTGTSTQSINQGLKPYGLVYALVKAKIPVQWIIKSDKTGFNTAAGNNQPDISQYDCDGPGSAYAAKDYISGAFVITKDFAAAAKPIIDSWKTSNAGLTVDGPCTNTPTTPFPVFATIKSWPRAVLDTQNGNVAVAYYNNAGIAQGSTTDANNPPAYRLASPSQLTPCDDMYIMPHADPTYATHSNLINFVKKGGDLYASCHAVSVLENIAYPAGHESATAKAMNFLTTKGMALYSAHSSQGSPAYTLGSAGTTAGGVTPGDPVAQFLGKPDLAMQQGSEQIFIPSLTIDNTNTASQWRPSTRIISYDTTQANTNGGSAVTNPKQAAAAIAYGPAWGDINAGMIMYQGGHSIAKGTADDVAAQRAFWNFQLLAAVSSSAVPSASDRTPTVVMTETSTTTASVNSVIPVSGYAVGGSGSYKYSWASSCFKSNGDATTSGTFANASSSDTTFRTPDVAGQINCNLTLTIIDTCGRFSFGFQTISVAPAANVRIAQTVSGTHTTATETTYTIVVTNDGAIRGTTSLDGNYAASVKVTSLIPTGATFGSVAISGSAPSGATCAQSIINGAAGWTCDLKDMTDEQVVTIILTLNPTVAGTLTNNVIVNTLSFDSDLSDNVDSDAVTVTEDVTVRPSLSMTKEPSVQQAAGNGKASFKLSVTNTTSGGDIALTNIVLTDNFNTLGSLTCYEGGRAVFDAATSGSTYTIPSLARGARWEAACTINGVFSSGTATTGTNTLLASYSYGGSSYTATSGAVTINKAASLEITKTEEGALKPGGLITYRVRIYNPTGNATATNISLTDTLPLGVTVESVTATNTNTSVQETATANVIAWDKFVNTTTTSQGWVASSWTLTTSGATTPVLSTSTNTSGLGTPFTSERNSIMIKAAASEAPSFSRTVTLNRNYKTVNVVFECSSQATGPTLKVSMAGTEIWRGTCTTARQSIVAAVPSAVFATAGAKELKFEVVANTATGTKAIFVDDVYVIGGLAASDQFTANYTSQQGLVSNWAETDSNNYLGVTTIGTTNAREGTTLLYHSSDSNNRNLSSTVGYFYYDPAKYSSMVIAYTCGSSTSGSSNDYFSITIGSTEIRKNNDTTKCERGSNNPITAESSMKLDTITVLSSLLPTSAGNVKITLKFAAKQSRDFGVSDFFILGREKGSSSVSVTYNTLAAALAGPYTLAAGEAKEISYTVRVPNPYSPSFLTGLVNTASVKSDQMANPAYSIISTPFAISKLGVKKSADSSTVASGSSVVYTYAVTNNGTAGSTIDTITVTDAGCASITLLSKNGDTASVLTPGKTWSYRCTVSNLTSDTATVVTVTGVDNLGDPQDNTDVISIKVSSPSLTVTASPAAKSIYAGNTVSYTYLVRNTGNVSLRNISVTAANCPSTRYKSGDPNGDLELEAGDTWTFVCTTGAINVSQVSQSVTASGTDVSIGTVATSSAVNVAVTVYNRPVVHITKTVKNTGPSPSGPSSSISVLESNTVTYEYLVSVETATLSSVRINDTGCSVPTSPDAGDTGTTVNLLEIGETWHFTCVAGKLLTTETATATATGIDSLGSRVQSDEVSTFVEVISPELLLSVTPDKEYIRKGQNVVYTYVISNIGGATFESFTAITDVNCAISLTGADSHRLAPGENWTFTCTKAATGTSMVSQFNVTGGYVTSSGSQSYSAAEATYKVFVMDPAMVVQKLAQVYKGTSSETRTAGFQSSVTAAIGDKIVFKYIVTGGEGSSPEVAGINAIVLTAINDSDCLVSTFAQVKTGGFNVGDSNYSGAIDKDEAWQFTCTAKTSLTASGAPTNTAMASPVTLDAATTLESGSSGIGIRKGGRNYTPDRFSAQSSATITLVPQLDPPSKKFTVAGAAAAVKSFSLLASPAGKNLSETSSATITIDSSLQNFSLAYNANGGTGAAPDSQFGSGNQIVSDAGALTKSGFRFAGWYTNANRTGGTAYAAGATFNLTTNSTLYAVWLANVTYDANGADTGTVGTDLNDYIPGSTVTITASSPTLEKTGATFAGWNTAADGSGTSYPASGTFTIPGEVTLYAKWTVSLSYNVNGGSGAVPATTTQLLNATPAAANKTNAMTNGLQSFIGWNSAADGSGADYFVGDNLDPLTANTVLYALWTSSPVYTITYLLESATAGSVPTDPRNYLNGASATLATNTGSLERTGYSFNGWSCNSVTYSEGASITIGSSNLVCTPRWNELAPSGGSGGSSGGTSGGGSVTTLPIITLDPNYPSGPTVVQQSGSGEITLLPNAFKRTGYKFKGWSRLAAGPVQILDGGKVTVTENLTLFAIWEVEPVITPVPAGTPVTINLNSNCAPRVIEKQTNAGKVKLNSNTFTCAGYAFTGWSTSPTGAVEYSDQALFNFVAPVTLYAVWAKSAVAPTITKGEYRFEVFFDMNSIAITSAENKNIAKHIALIKKKAGANASYKVVVEGWVQPNPKPGNIKYLSEGRAKRVAALMRTLGLKATYKELYKGLGADNMPKARHASIIVTWTTSK